MGEKIADFIGLNDSRYPEVMDEYLRLEEAKKKKLEKEAEEISKLELGTESDSNNKISN